MCYYTKVIITEDELESHYGYEFVDRTDYQMGEQINGFSHPQMPILLHQSLDVFEWGLIPSWAKDKSIQKSTLNARIETIKEKASYRNNVTNRCLLLVNGFYEWKLLDNGKKEKYLIQLKNEEVFGLACIYSIWKQIKTFSIVTKQANRLMSEIHNTKKRMPVVVIPELNQDWLTNAKIEDYATMNVELEANLVS